MLAQRSASSSALRSNYMAALTSPELSPSCPPTPPSSKPEEFTIEMSDILLPASALESELFGVPHDSGATVVSASSADDIASTTLKPRSRKPRKSNKASAAQAIMLSRSGVVGDATTAITTQPVPEFLCHLFTMLRDQSYADLISWQVPNSDEPDHIGGGMAGIGKIVVHRPEALQDHVLGKYYRHSKYASFQRQLNYFGFKKRLHHGKKGKLSPCSYIHELLTDDVASLFSLKRRPPAKKRVTITQEDDAASLSSLEDSTASTSSRPNKKRRLSAKKANKKMKKNKKSRRATQHGKQQIIVSSVPLQVQAEEYAPPPLQSSATVVSAVAPKPIGPVSAEPSAYKSSAVIVQPSATTAAPPATQPTLMEMLKTTLPTADVLFNDDLDALLDDGAPLYVTDTGYRHDVDSSLVELAMLY